MLSVRPSPMSSSRRATAASRSPVLSEAMAHFSRISASGSPDPLPVRSKYRSMPPAANDIALRSPERIPSSNIRSERSFSSAAVSDAAVSRAEGGLELAHADPSRYFSQSESARDIPSRSRPARTSSPIAFLSKEAAASSSGYRRASASYASAARTGFPRPASDSPSRRRSRLPPQVPARTGGNEDRSSGGDSRIARMARDRTSFSKGPGSPQENDGAARRVPNSSSAA